MKQVVKFSMGTMAVIINLAQVCLHFTVYHTDWTEHCFTSPPTQYRLYGRRFLQVRRPNQQYQSTEGTNSTQTNLITQVLSWWYARNSV